MGIAFTTEDAVKTIPFYCLFQLCLFQLCLFQQRLAVVVQLAVKHENRVTVRKCIHNDAVPLIPYIKQWESAFPQQELGLLQRGFHSEAQAEQFIPGRTACTGKNLIGINLIQVAVLHDICFRHSVRCDERLQVGGKRIYGKFTAVFF